SQDVLRVVAYDTAGNRAVKDIHIGSSVAGGAVTGDIPILTATAEADSSRVAAGGEVTFTFRLSNDGNGACHPFADVAGPPGWTFTWDPVHVAVMPGETKEQKLVVHAGSGPGTFAVNASFRYQAGAEEKVLLMPLHVTVGGATSVQPVTTTTKAAFLPPLAPLVLAGAALVARGRQGTRP
ncbi:MAG: hypothetical protein LC620_08640, partial [Halobacteriales archaeon]|nr:hypothetical protein [Halobacteriales archaeon]